MKISILEKVRAPSRIAFCEGPRVKKVWSLDRNLGERRELLLASADVGEREVALASFLANVADERVVLVGAVAQVVEPRVGFRYVLVFHCRTLLPVWLGMCHWAEIAQLLS